LLQKYSPVYNLIVAAELHPWKLVKVEAGDEVMEEDMVAVKDRVEDKMVEAKAEEDRVVMVHVYIMVLISLISPVIFLPLNGGAYPMTYINKPWNLRQRKSAPLQRLMSLLQLLMIPHLLKIQAILSVGILINRVARRKPSPSNNKNDARPQQLK
jgi:hypothetical protein